MWNVISLILCNTRPLNCQLFYCGCALALLYDCWFYNINTQIRGFQMLVCFVRVQYMNINQEHFLTKLINAC